MFYTIISGFSRLALHLRAPTGTTESFNAMAKILHEVNVPTKKATFAMACFWAPDALFGVQKGVIRTRVGYAGGSTPSPIYHGHRKILCHYLGDQKESIEIEFDETQTSYAELLTLFWANHDPTARMTKQYTSLILTHDDEQRKLAEESLVVEQAKRKAPLVTKVLPASEFFYSAEDYHQKYRLQQHAWLMTAIGLKPNTVTNSHAAARLNGFVVGMGGVAFFEEEAPRLGLSTEVTDFVRKLVVKYEGHGLTC